LRCNQCERNRSHCTETCREFPGHYGVLLLEGWQGGTRLQASHLRGLRLLRRQLAFRSV